jgi:hypothetical protein
VGSQIIHHDDVVAPERWSQTLPDVGQEHLSGHGSLDHHRRGHFIVTQGGDEGYRLPFSKGDIFGPTPAA